MARYVDAFVIPVPKKDIPSYRALARKSAILWRKNGALDCVECVADDVAKGKVTSFPRSVKLKRGETVVLTTIVYKSRAHREQVMKKAMNDANMHKIWDAMPIDGMRMFFGGFKSIAGA